MVPIAYTLGRRRVSLLLVERANDDGSFTVANPGYKLESKANARDHFRTAARKTKEQRALGQAMATRLPRDLPCTITCTRFGKRSLDTRGNLEHAFKAVRDGIADVLVGVPRKVKRKGQTITVVVGDDSDPRITWDFLQERGDYAITVRVSR